MKGLDKYQSKKDTGVFRKCRNKIGMGQSGSFSYIIIEKVCGNGGCIGR